MLKGIAWPITLGDVNTIETVYDEDVVAASIRTILETQRGERRMRPQLGADIYQYVFENADVATAVLIKRSIINAIRVGEPRVTLVSVKAEITDTQINVYIEYEFNNKIEDITIPLPR